MSDSGERSRILVAMSGGVDSSVAAALLVEAGHDVVGATMKTFCYSDDPSMDTRTCCGLEGIQDARAVSDTLGIPHYVFDVEDEFQRDVMDDFVAEYAQGRTPNPCVRCNSNTKFRDLMRRGRALGCEGIASGHYVRLRRSGDGVSLLRGIDQSKDQSYFLWGLERAHLERLHFPVGELTKAQVRARARQLRLATADKPESQDICFVPTGNYRDFLATRLLPTHSALSPGTVVDLQGRVLGRHDGYAGFTVGQRKRVPGGLPEPHYVVEIRPETREVVVGPKSLLAMQGMIVGDLNWLSAPPGPGSQVTCQIRYRSPPLACRVAPGGADELSLWLRDSVAAVTPGQSCVVFRGDQVLGGGRIRGTARA